ncbi:MAG: DHH family phosphoesterase [Sarcina sp.]
MIKYKVREQGIDIVDTVFTNRNITQQKAKEILSSTRDNEECASNYKNMDKAVERYQKAIRKGETIATLVDEDLDGFTSSALFLNFTNNDMNYNNIEYIMQAKAKVHGLNKHVLKEVQQRGVTLLITPDSSSSDKVFHEELNKMGISIIVLDHHEFHTDDVGEGAIVVNCQDGNVSNTSLSGCGVTYKFIREVARVNDIVLGEKYLDLVALSLVGDIMDLRSLENRYYLEKGSKLENITNPFLLYFIDKKKTQEFISIEEHGFEIAPIINATIRLGDRVDKDKMFRSLLDRFEEVESEKRGEKGKGIFVPIYMEGFRIATNYKSKQDKLRDKNKDAIVEKFGLDIKDKVFIQDVTDDIDAAMGGLIANKLTDIYNRPIILLRLNKKDNTYYGSGRTVNGISAFENLKEMCLQTGEFEYARGHRGALGLSIKLNKLESAREKLNYILSDVEVGDYYEVDGEYNQVVPLAHVKAIAEYEDLWCNHIKSPLFIIKGVRMNSANIEKVGNATYTFKIGDVKFTKNFGSKVWYEEVAKIEDLPFGGDIIADIVCKFRRNKKGYYWCDIEHMVSKINEEEIIDF